MSMVSRAAFFFASGSFAGGIMCKCLFDARGISLRSRDSCDALALAAGVWDEVEA